MPAPGKLRRFLLDGTMERYRNGIVPLQYRSLYRSFLYKGMVFDRYNTVPISVLSKLIPIPPQLSSRSNLIFENTKSKIRLRLAGLKTGPTFKENLDWNGKNRLQKFYILIRRISWSINWTVSISYFYMRLFRNATNKWEEQLHLKTVKNDGFWTKVEVSFAN